MNEQGDYMNEQNTYMGEHSEDMIEVWVTLPLCSNSPSLSHTDTHTPMGEYRREQG